MIVACGHAASVQSYVVNHHNNSSGNASSRWILQMNHRALLLEERTTEGRDVYDKISPIMEQMNNLRKTMTPVMTSETAKLHECLETMRQEVDSSLAAMVELLRRLEQQVSTLALRVSGLTAEQLSHKTTVNAAGTDIVYSPLKNDFLNSTRRRLEVLMHNAVQHCEEIKMQIKQVDFARRGLSRKFHQQDKNSRRIGRDCVFCQGRHTSDSCGKFPDVQERIRIVEEAKRCLQCLGRHDEREDDWVCERSAGTSCCYCVQMHVCGMDWTERPIKHHHALCEFPVRTREAREQLQILKQRQQEALGHKRNLQQQLEDVWEEEQQDSRIKRKRREEETLITTL